ncbi:MAG: hypothetical protein WCF20_07325 [Methylovirgula sp.]
MPKAACLINSTLTDVLSLKPHGPKKHFTRPRAIAAAIRLSGRNRFATDREARAGNGTGNLRLELAGEIAHGRAGHRGEGSAISAAVLRRNEASFPGMP